jgi:alanyl-tRNA synthetase
MKFTGLNELREKYLSFFESKEHLRLPSFPLIPQDDKSLLLINAGMVPLKKYFLGQVTPPSKRVTTCQKCIRTPDIERVGKTSRHGTYFEMLGNFSFGDYFKHEATGWAWEFITKVLEMPEDKLWVSIFEKDDEAFDIWTKEVGISPSRIVRLGKADNFWELSTGPCGPCSEIYFDRGEQYSCGSPDCAVGCDCDRYVEFWNLVFTQFNSDGNGNYEPLAKPNIDTGMGLERLACIMQGVNNLFEVDTVQEIMKHVIKFAGISYGDEAKKDVSLRVITDHIRGTTFMVGDGVIPSNEGRGYVLRRLLRRAARHGRLLGITGNFLAEVCETVINENKTAYSELVEKQDYIKKVILHEEERFNITIDQGLQLLSAMIEKLVSDGQTVLNGEDAFRLYDTFGFPVDLTRDILEERTLSVDEDGFTQLMKEQREKARAARATNDTSSWVASNDEDTAETTFVGYEAFECEANIEAIIANGERIGIAKSGDKVSIILDKTPFYAEGGGQVGDCGVIISQTAAVRINGCKKSPTGRFVHASEVISGNIAINDKVTAKVDIIRRNAIMRNHSAAHLLQASLRRVLGNHVQQAGQLVDENKLRFDFTHFSGLTQQELDRVEQEVNDAILSGLDVNVKEMSINEAKKSGAMALFGEKYGDHVRVVKMGGFSLELCGGTHIDNTAKIGLFKIVYESSVAAGVRRIEGATGYNLLELLNNTSSTLRETATALKTNNIADVAKRAAQLTVDLKSKDREIEQLQGKIAGMQLEGLLSKAKEIKGIKVITDVIKGSSVDAVRLITDKIKDAEPNAVVVLACITDGKLNFMASCGKDAVQKGTHAGNIVKAVALLTGGGGGGKPDSAMAGGKDISKVEEALKTVITTVESMIK